MLMCMQSVKVGEDVRGKVQGIRFKEQGSRKTQAGCRGVENYRHSRLTIDDSRKNTTLKTRHPSLT